jgi:SAM-dependent methyltransferase
MNDIIEHLDDILKVMEEIHRLLKIGGKVYIRVVYWNHRYAFSDPTHKKFFTETTFDFFTGKKRVYYTTARFKLKKMEYIYDSKAKRIFRFKRIMDFLSYFLCNVRQGMKVELIKK